jgi:methyl-accepting chemotaxis protein
LIACEKGAQPSLLHNDFLENHGKENVMKFANLKVAAKIALGFSLPFLLFVGFGLWLWMTMGNISDRVTHVRTESAVFAIYAKDMQREAVQIQQYLTDISATRGQDGLDTGFKEAKASYDKFNEYHSAFLKMFTAEGNEQGVDKMRAIKGLVDAYYESGSKMAQAYIEGGSVAGNKLMAEFDASREKLDVMLQPLIKEQVDELGASTEAVDDAARKTRVIALAVSVFAMLVVGVVGFIISRSITRQLGGEPAYAALVAQRIAAGDLSVSVDVNGKDASSLLAAMAAMQQKLTGIVDQIKGAAEAIGSGTKQIASGNADLSQRTEEQASSLEETASSMEELTSTVKQNAENAKQANQLALGASTVAVKGGQVVGQVVETMSSINESSKKIVDIIGVIDGIAFQTNILALNAAVEAARAGEQGRGFAVVASEVRNLAQRSAAAAKEIKQLIGDSVDKVGAGTKLVDEAGKTMEEIVGSVKRVTDIMGEITAASQEQSAGIEQVNQAITQMDEVTQQNAALVEEAAAAAESLQEQAQNLETAVAVFKLDGTAAGAAILRRSVAMEKQEQPVQPPAERRGPGRAQNVARLRRKPAAVRAAAPKAKTAAAGGEDRWEEF